MAEVVSWAIFIIGFNETYISSVYFIVKVIASEFVFSCQDFIEPRIAQW